MYVIRVQQITIDIPKQGVEPWVVIILERDRLDDEGNIVSSEPFWDRVYRKQSDFVQELYDIFDPVLFKRTDISGAGVAVAIEALALSWAANDKPAHWENGRVVLDATGS